MTSLGQLVQDWLDLDKVRICSTTWDSIMPHYTGSWKRQGPRFRDYGNQKIARSWRVGSGIYLPVRPFIIAR